MEEADIICTHFSLSVVTQYKEETSELLSWNKKFQRKESLRCKPNHSVGRKPVLNHS